MKGSSVYAAIDLKSFYASVECMERGLDPLQARLVVADPSRTSKTICLAVSPALKSYGIPGRARLFEVEQKIREIEKRTGERISYLTAPPRMALYTDYSARIFSIYLRHVAPEDIYPYSIDEVFVDLTHYLPAFHPEKSSGHPAHDFCREMIRKVREETGITATAGIGTNLFLAKAAMDIVSKHTAPDRDGVRIAQLDEMSYRRKLWSHRPLTDFWRVGASTARKLEPYGIFTMGDIARQSLVSEELFYRLFHDEAEILIDHAWGLEPCTIADIKAYEPKSSSICAGQVLPEPSAPERTRLILREMADNLALELTEKQIATSRLVLEIGYDRQNIDLGTISGKTYTGKTEQDRYRRKLPYHARGTAALGRYTSSTRVIAAALLQVCSRILDSDLWVRRITVTACDLAGKGLEGSAGTGRKKDRYPELHGEQLSLFDSLGEPNSAPSPDSALEKMDREQKVQETVVTLKKRFGKNAVLRGMNLEKGATAKDRNRKIGGHNA